MEMLDIVSLAVILLHSKFSSCLMSLSIWWMLILIYMVDIKLTSGNERVIITVPMFIRHAHHTKTIYKIVEKPTEQPVFSHQITIAQPQHVGPKDGPGSKYVAHGDEHEHIDEIIHHHVHVGHINHGHSHKVHSHQKRNRGHGQYHSDKHGHAHHHSGKHHHGRKPKHNRGHKHSDYKHGKDNRGHLDNKHRHKGKSNREDYNHKNKHHDGHKPRGHTNPGYKTAGHVLHGGYQVKESEDVVSSVNFDDLLTTMPVNMKSFLTSSQTPTDLQDGMSSLSVVSSTPTMSNDVYFTLDPELPYDVTLTSQHKGKTNKSVQNTMKET